MEGVNAGLEAIKREKEKRESDDRSVLAGEDIWMGELIDGGISEVEEGMMEETASLSKLNEVSFLLPV